MKPVIKFIRRKLRPIRARWEGGRGHIALLKLRLHLKRGYVQEAHNLPGELVVSLTSYAPRFPTLLPTLQCLLSQSIKADRIILWLAEEDIPLLPESIQRLADQGLEIRVAENQRSYTKIIPALTAYPKAFIVTADDDVYYEPDWLRMLIQAWNGQHDTIVCHAAHRILTDNENMPIAYNDWKRYVNGPCSDNDIYFLGVGGVLYPPGALPMPDVLDVDTFRELSPSADDVWLNWMARLAGTTVMKTRYNTFHTVWPGSQNVSLRINTELCENDYQMRRMIARFGFPMCS